MVGLLSDIYVFEPEIIYEDEDILAVNKPAGLLVHSNGRTKEPDVASWFLEKYPDSSEVGEPMRLSDGKVINRPGIVHRIDRETSGVLLLAKTALGHTVLKKQFQNREVEKFYQAFVYGLVKDDRGTINIAIGRSPRDFRRWSAERGARGEMRPAITYYEVLKRAPEEGVTLVEVKPKTGRTHQIRVHFRALQRPIVADALYAPKKPKLLNFERLALHARKIVFKNTQGERVEVLAPYPEDFRRAIAKVGFNVLD